MNYYMNKNNKNNENTSCLVGGFSQILGKHLFQNSHKQVGLVLCTQDILEGGESNTPGEKN